MTDIAPQIVTAVATSATTLAAVGLTLFATTRSERQRARDADVHRNHQERQEAAVTFLAIFDAFYFACLNYQAHKLDELPNEIRSTQLTAGARVELFFPKEVRDAARNSMKCLNLLWDAVQEERAGKKLAEDSSAADLIARVGDARTAFLRSARFAVGEQ
jgi:hypothetical protein